MKQHIFTLFFVLLSPFYVFSQRKPDFKITKSTSRKIKPLALQSYKRFNATALRNGYEITVPGNYAYIGSNCIIRDIAADNPVVSANVTVNNVAKTDVVLAIRSSNVVVDMGGTKMVNDKNADFTAIVISDDVHNVTIRNGSIGSGDYNFDGGIIVGHNCNNILIEDFSIQGCDDSTNGAIHLQGTSATTEAIRNITLRNIDASNNTTVGIKCSYCKDLTLENIRCNSNSSTGVINNIHLNYCTRVIGKNIEANNISGTGATRGFFANNSNNVKITQLSATNISDGTNTKAQGVEFNNSENVTLSYVQVNNITQCQHAFYTYLCNGVEVNYLEASNCTDPAGATNASFVHIATCTNLKINHATISNNSVTNGDIAAIFCRPHAASPCKNIEFNDVTILNNSSAGGATNHFYGIRISDTESLKVNNCKIAQNTSTADCYGITASTNSSNIFINNTEIINNSTTSSTDDSTVKGINCDSVDGLEIYGCNISSNNGSNKTFGMYITDLDYAVIKNCTAQGNRANSAAFTAKRPSAGLYLRNCNYCITEDCLFNNNQAGSLSAAATIADAAFNLIDFADTTVGAGIINIGTTITNTGNSFTNCICNNNRTQDTATPGVGHVNIGGNFRYSTELLLACGAGNQDAANTTYKNCTFNNNGSSLFLLGCGVINVTNAVKTCFINCTSNNNSYYGFTDTGTWAGATTNAQIYCIGCLAITNGSDNPNYAEVEVADGTHRNCLAYYTTIAARTPPFIELALDDISDDLVPAAENNSPYINISIIETS